ncbi:MAG TPA: sulfatase [Chthoniobacteraceae bacterium]|nr:sulfatase [Chthoniobacteraceae bacterium]
MISRAPNLLFIVTDDHACGAISSYGSRLNRTPNIDRLAAEGMRLERCFCTNAVCTPARATILTGQYGHINGVRGNGETLDGSRPGLLPKRLQAAGYQTALFGKWHLGHGGHADPTGFDDWRVFPGMGEYENPTLLEQGVERRHSGYVTDVLTGLSTDWISRRDRERPFFLMLAHRAPHRPFEPAARHRCRYLEGDLPEPATLFDDYEHRAPAAREARMRIARDLTLTDLKEELPAGLDPGEAARWKYQRYIKDYVRCCDGLDESVGTLLDHLEREGIAENTLVVYTSDHGFFLGEHGWFDKRFMYEPAMRIPFLARYPAEIAPGSTAAEMVANIDFAPTLLDYAGAAAPEEMQGRSFRSILQGQSPADWRKSVYYRYWIHLDKSHRVGAHYGIRTDRYKLIRYYGRAIDCRGASPEVTQPAWELFDLKEDPDELRDVHAQPEYAAIFRTLQEELREAQAHYGDSPA